ncbi:hypothetical protein HCH52_06400 [Oscillospiraceae bacterium HV4-5-C5C]|nr:hypothetical protein [Oscillospiraceae bacterium HV4-5-C5C]
MDPAVTKLTQYIERQAQAEADLILQQAQEEALRRQTAGEREQADWLARQQELLAKRNLQATVERHQQWQQELTRQQAAEAVRLVDALFEQLEQELTRLPGRAFQTFFMRSLRQVPPSGIYRLALGQQSAARLPQLLPDQLLEMGRQAGYQLQPESAIPQEGGFVLRQPPVTYSFLFSDLLSELKKNRLPDILQQLLGGEGLNG